MNKPLLFLILVLALSLNTLQAQYPIGNFTKSFYDANRSDREVPVAIYYPATIAGESSPSASGTFPYIVFGHGFSMGYSAYMNFVDSLVPEGYIIVFADTETGTGPSHETFGFDLAFLINAMVAEGADNASILFQHIDSRVALMGHSMGGGSSFLAAANNTNLTTLVNFAAAETDPSSTTAAASVSVPTLVMAGEEDAVAPPDENQIPMYQATASACKAYVSINGGGHCNFANYNFTCSVGEFFTGSGSTDRPSTHSVIFAYVKPWLKYHLYQDASSWTQFSDSIQNGTRATSEMSCDQTNLPNIITNDLLLLPNPANDNFVMVSESEQIFDLEIINLQGQQVLTQKASTQQTVSVEFLPEGCYFVKLYHNKNYVSSHKLIISR